MEASINQARAAKNELVKRIGGHPDVVGVGLTRSGTGWVVKVNLRREKPALDLPSRIDCVPIVVDVVGPISAQ